jgi:flagellar hook-associated protein 2
VDGYNGLIDTADSYMVNHPKSGRLVREMYNLAALHEEDLENVGLHLHDDGHIELDKDKLLSAVAEGGMEQSVSGIKNFAGAILKKSNQVALNPMHYADRTVVAYKNPGHNFATPYVTSAYTGMMFNSYC